MSESQIDVFPALAEHDALRADIYRLVARLVRQPPDGDLLGFLANLEVADDGDEPSDEFRTHWIALSLAAGRGQVSDLEQAHFRHLVGVINGELLPYASWYLAGSLMEMPLVELRRDLRRLGFERAPAVKEPEDHFSALCEVMAMLIETDLSAQGAFFHRHLAPWGSRFMTDLAAVDTPFYAAVGHLGLAFLTFERTLHLPMVPKPQAQK